MRCRKEGRENARFTRSTKSDWTWRRLETQAVGEKGKHRIHLAAQRSIQEGRHNHRTRYGYSQD
jgi:hypothetical protein